MKIRLNWIRQFMALQAVLKTSSAIAAGTLALSSPSDYQVIQRGSSDAGILHIQGKTTFIAKKWQYRLLGKPLSGKPNETWHRFQNQAKEGNVDFVIKAPAGGWYRLEVRGQGADGTSAETSVAHVGVGEVFIIAGQSNAGNYGAGTQITRSGDVGSFSGVQWALANDPQQGAGGWDGGGSFMPAFGDAMNERFHVPIGIVAIADGGTSVREWLPKGSRIHQQPTTGGHVSPAGPGEWTCTGALFDRFSKRFDALGTNGFRAILWHQGESDAGQARAGYPADRQITGEQYFQFMSDLIDATRKQAGWPLPWFTAQTTYHSEQDASDPEFRAAMRKLWDRGLSLEGPDTDDLRAGYRAGVHFNSNGLQKHGQMWAEKVGPWLEKQLIQGEAGPSKSKPSIHKH